MKIDLRRLISGEGKRNPVDDSKRPVKMVAESPNVWRIVYAD